MVLWAELREVRDEVLAAAGDLVYGVRERYGTHF